MPLLNDIDVHCMFQEIEIPQQLINMYQVLDEPCGIKDLNSRFIYANQAYLNLIGLSANFPISGKSDHEIPSRTSVFYDKFKEHDALVIKSEQRKSSIEIHTYRNDDYLDAYVFDKFPFYDSNKKIVGIYFHGRKAFNLDFDCVGFKNAGSISLHKPSDMFTESEWEIVFWLLKNKSQKEIAIILDRSPARISNKISTIYLKSHVSNIRQFIEFINEMGWSNFIPSRFVKSGHILLD